MTFTTIKAICCYLIFSIAFCPEACGLVPITSRRLFTPSMMKVHGCGMPRTTTHCRSKLVLQENPSRFPDVDFKTKDSALFKLEEQSLSDWSTFCVAVGAVLSVVYFAWLSPSGFNLGNKFIESLEQLAGGSSSITMSIMYLVFATVHSGLAGMRQYAETVVGARAWRYVFALFSLPLALSCILYFINHRYDGVMLWEITQLPGIHSMVWISSLLSFFLLYPATFNLLEVAAVKEPAQHLWEGGVMRITRHPQMVGQLLWCAAHTAYVGSSFMCVTSALLCVHHLFGVWHGDARLRSRFGAAAEAYQARTSVAPFAAILDGRQALPRDYYKEFLRLPYLVVLLGSLLAYQLHPQMLVAAASIRW